MKHQQEMFKQHYNPLPIYDEWAYLVHPNILNRTSKVFKQVKELRETRVIYPEHDEVFRAFKLKPSKVKVVIIGQDPYFNENANGLAFSCKESISPSLGKIFDAIDSKYKRRFYNKELLHWERQGVLLLNTCLTVSKGSPLSHSSLGWDKFIIPLLTEFSNQYKEVVYMLWGASAKRVADHLHHKDNLILTEVHPAYASRYNIAWECKHFKQANEYFKNRNQKQINW